MHIGFFLSYINYYRHFDQVVRILCQEGDKVSIVTKFPTTKPNLTNRSVETAIAEIPGVSFGTPFHRWDPWKKILRPTRELLNYTSYFHPDHPSRGLSVRWKTYFAPSTWRYLNEPWAINFLTSSLVQHGLRTVERVAPPSRGIVRRLKEGKIDLVVASPLVTGNNKELEYVKAAKAIGIPTVYALASWDNLTTKGTIHVQPDLVFVWNQPILEEAIKLHGVPRENIVITGAPTFDYWFDMKPSLDRATFCHQAGIEAGRPYAVYLCSSRRMIGDEITFIRDLANQLGQNPETKDVILLVRPHPYNQLDFSQLNEKNIRVFPEQGDLPDVPEVKQIYFNTLYYAKATIGVNTSAMLEAAIADIPCVTIIDERYRHSQSDMGHFRHLVNGDFLQMTYSYEEATFAIALILDGQDVKRESRRRFVKNFIRPYGLDRPVSKLFARALRMAAKRESAAQIMLALEKD
jgi:hypothetical protein